jgi:hypothetical protein
MNLSNSPNPIDIAPRTVLELLERPRLDADPTLIARAVFLFARGARDGFNPEFEPSTSEWIACLSRQAPAHIRTAIGDSGLAGFRQLFLNANQDLPPAVGLIADIDRCQLTLAGSDSLGARPRAWTSGWQTLAFVLVPLRANELQAARGFLARSVTRSDSEPMANEFARTIPEVDALDAAFPSISKTRDALRCWLRAIERAAESESADTAAETLRESVLHRLWRLDETARMPLRAAAAAVLRSHQLTARWVSGDGGSAWASLPDGWSGSSSPELVIWFEGTIPPDGSLVSLGSRRTTIQDGRARIPMADKAGEPLVDPSIEVSGSVWSLEDET